MTWVTPKQFLASRNITVAVGDVLNPETLGMPEHPQYGKLPVIEVTKADKGVFVEGVAACNDCGTQITIHAGDWFQKRRCERCQRKAQRRAANPPLSAEVKAERLQTRQAEKAERDATKAQEKAAKAEERAKKIQEKAAEKAKKIQAEAEARAAKLSGKEPLVAEKATA
jgi:DNA-directed RNA polymerase subunit M/transcription elongation factor TFIIS